MIGQLRMGCTATLMMIVPSHGSALCLQRRKLNERQRTDFTPAQNGSNYKPYGTFSWLRAYTPSEWIESRDSNFDIALVVLKESIGNRLGWMTLKQKTRLANQKVTITGYPYDKNNEMWTSSCEIFDESDYQYYYDCDTEKGNSGSALYLR